MDLGTKRPKDGSVSPVETKRPEMSYPSFSISDKVAQAFHKEHENCKIGDEITATVKLKVTSLRSDDYGHSVGFDVQSMDNIEYEGNLEHGDKEEDTDKKEESEEADGDDEEKILGYRRKTVKPAKEAPDTSAKSLYD